MRSTAPVARPRNAEEVAGRIVKRVKRHRARRRRPHPQRRRPIVETHAERSVIGIQIIKNAGMLQRSRRDKRACRIRRCDDKLRSQNIRDMRETIGRYPIGRKPRQMRKFLRKRPVDFPVALERD